MVKILDMNSTELKILRELQITPEISRSELLEKTSVNNQSLQYNLGKLQGLIQTRSGDNPTGRKKFLYSLTKAGQLYLASINERIRILTV
tara:strand:- start:463 stop:732 length:270 start_codon:yes stop_codon:yes gene_type:complete